MSEALRMYKWNTMQEEDIQALHRLEAIFKEAAINNDTVQIQATTQIPSPRVQAQQQQIQDHKALTTAVEEMAKPPRVEHTMFEPEEHSIPPSRVEPNT